MRRTLIIALLAFGTVAGYGSGIAHLAVAHHAHHCAADRQADSVTPK